MLSASKAYAVRTPHSRQGYAFNIQGVCCQRPTQQTKAMLSASKAYAVRAPHSRQGYAFSIQGLCCQSPTQQTRLCFQHPRHMLSEPHIVDKVMLSAPKAYVVRTPHSGQGYAFSTQGLCCQEPHSSTPRIMLSKYHSSTPLQPQSNTPLAIMLSEPF